MVINRVPRAVPIPYPDLRQAIRDIELRDFSSKFDYSVSPKKRPVKEVTIRSPSRLVTDTPVFMYFGRQFHRSNTVRLGDPLTIAVVLKDKCGNVIRDRRQVLEEGEG